MSTKKKTGSKIATRGGVYSLIITSIVLAIIIVLRMFFWNANFKKTQR